MQEFEFESEPPQNYVRGSLSNEIRWSGRGGVKKCWKKTYKSRKSRQSINNENQGIIPTPPRKRTLRSEILQKFYTQSELVHS